MNMDVCYSYQFNSSDIFSFEKIAGPEILKWVPQSIADLAKSHFPFVEGRFKYCEDPAVLLGEWHQEIKTVIRQNFHPLQTNIYPNQFGLGKNGGSTFVQKTDGWFTRAEEIKTLCSTLKINTETHLKDLITQELDKTWQYQLYQKSNEIGVAAIAIISSALIGYGIYKIYKKCHQMTSPILQEPRCLSEITSNMSNTRNALSVEQPSATSKKTPQHVANKENAKKLSEAIRNVFALDQNYVLGYFRNSDPVFRNMMMALEAYAKNGDLLQKIPAIYGYGMTGTLQPETVVGTFLAALDSSEYGGIQQTIVAIKDALDNNKLQRNQDELFIKIGEQILELLPKFISVISFK